MARTVNINSGDGLSRGVILIIAIAVLCIIILFKSFTSIKSGEAGVLYERFGGGVNTTDILDEGFHIVAPWNEVFIYEVRQQEAFEKMAVLSSNGLEIGLDASVWYQPDFDKLGWLHKTKGQNYLSRVIQPAARSAARSVIGKYTPDQIYSSKKDAIQKEIFNETNKILSKQFIQLNAVLLRDVTLPVTIKTAIETKLKQEQESQEYEFRLEKATKEAEKQRIEAEGKAAANRILNASLTDKILQEKGIQATLELAASKNAKTVIVGGKNGMPLILNH